MKKKVINFTYYFWFFVLLFAIPISCALFAGGIAELIRSKNEYVSFFLGKKAIDYGYPYFISLVLSLISSMLVVVYLKKRFMLFEIEKNNHGTLFWMIIACYLITQHIQIYFYPNWWVDNVKESLDYELLGNVTKKTSNLYVYILPHLLNTFFLFFAIQLLIWISDIEKSFKEVRLLFKKLFFTKEELQKIIDYKIEVPIENKDEFEEQKEFFLNQKKYFTYSDYKHFRKKIQFENSEVLN
ncbi:hypothetical protein [Bernardetia sp.]|uniref:hypothetical protein n=1 Tax=Bernardetia sp. TaxID=1937974 RepID=UPI0025B98E09|nr:hypothetical protein [Bernardetia sp.]